MATLCQLCMNSQGQGELRFSRCIMMTVVDECEEMRGGCIVDTQACVYLRMTACVWLKPAG